MLKRDEKKYGVDDFVLLEDYSNEDAFIENLRIRHQSDIVYVNKPLYIKSKFMS